MENILSIAEAKSAFSECVRKVMTGSIVTITKHGKPVAALVSPEDLEHLERLRKAGPEKGLASITGGWDNSEELVKILEESDRQGQRNTSHFD